MVAALGDVLKHGSDRETNLNTRGAAVAAVAGVIVALSSAIGKSLVATDEWTGGWKDATVVLFLIGLAVVAAAMVAVVLGVLRPKRGPATEIFAAQEFSKLWVGGKASLLVADKQKDPRLIFADSSLRTLPRWYYRNRIKARWLRRAYVLLAVGVAVIGLAGVFALSHEADFPIEGSVLIVLGAVVSAGVAIWLDLVGAVTDREQDTPGWLREAIQDQDGFTPAEWLEWETIRQRRDELRVAVEPALAERPVPSLMATRDGRRLAEVTVSWDEGARPVLPALHELLKKVADVDADR